jgi:RimJ/RimL family protein N-acetyltransferase
VGNRGHSLIVFGDAVCHFVTRETGGEYFDGSGQGIGIERDGEIVCGVLFENYNGRSVQIHVAVKPGSRMTKEWLRTLFRYAFCELKVNKIIGVVDSTNPAALNFDRHIGFKDEAVIEGAGRYGDLILLSMTKNNCKYLGN